MSNLQPNCCLEFDFRKVDQHAGGKWLIHDTKRRKDNQLQSLKLPCRISKLSSKMWHKGVAMVILSICIIPYIFYIFYIHLISKESFIWLSLRTCIGMSLIHRHVRGKASDKPITFVELCGNRYSRAWRLSSVLYFVYIPNKHHLIPCVAIYPPGSSLYFWNI